MIATRIYAVINAVGIPIEISLFAFAFFVVLQSRDHSDGRTSFQTSINNMQLQVKMVVIYIYIYVVRERERERKRDLRQFVDNISHVCHCQKPSVE